MNPLLDSEMDAPSDLQEAPAPTSAWTEQLLMDHQHEEVLGALNRLAMRQQYDRSDLL